MTKTKPMQRVLSVVALLALALTTLVLPAYAAGPSATASLAVDDREVLAGTTNLFDITVTNTEAAGGVLGGGGASIDWVLVNVSTAFADLTADDVTATLGWDGPVEVRDNQMLFTAATADDALAPTESLAITVNANVARPDRDKGGIFQIQVSGDDGANTGPAAAASPGALSSALRILDVSRIAVIEPVLAADHTVTDGQDNTVVAVDVTNLGSGAKDVTAALAETGAATFTARGTQPGAQSVAPGTTSTFLFPVTFARDGATPPARQSTELSATATAANASNDTAPGVRRAVEVQAPVKLSYAANSLTPRDVSASKKDVSLGLQKTGVPTSTLTLAGQAQKGGATVPTAGPITVPATTGSDNQAIPTVTFPQVPFDQAGLTDGEYSFDLSASGTDGNGATIDLADIPVADLIYLDLDAPILTITSFEAPASHVDGENAAATSGEAFTLTGNVTDRGQGCGDCSVTGTLTIAGVGTSSVMVPVAGDGTFDTPVNVGTIDQELQSASVTLDLVAIDATAEDNADHKDTATEFGEVDTRAAALGTSAPLTGGLGDLIGEDEDTSRIDVLFDEGIAANLSTSALNWSVQVDGGGDNVVTDAAIRTATAAESATVGDAGSITEGETVWFVELTLQNALDGNADATVTYVPNSRTGVGIGEATGTTRIHDRVDLPLVEGVKETIDNIAPDLPIIQLVADKAPQQDDDGTVKFFTNDEIFDVQLADVELGSTVQLKLREADGTVRDLADSGPVSDDTYTFTGVNVAGADRALELFVEVSDNGRKVTEGGDVTVLLDRVAPAVASALYDGDETITVTTDEGLVGRDRAFDWFANATDAFGDPVTIFVNAVTLTPGNESYDLRQRDLDLDTTTYDPATSDVSLETLVYDFQGSADDDQYTDRAGNLFERQAPIDITAAGGGAPAPAPAPSQGGNTSTPVTAVTDLLSRRKG